VAGDYERAGLSNESKDIVTINNIESRPSALIKQADRILKPAGLIIVTFEINDIFDLMGIDDAVEKELKKMGYELIRALLPDDYPVSSTLKMAPLFIIARKPAHPQA
jgi:hypothetical protein